MLDAPILDDLGIQVSIDRHDSELVRDFGLYFNSVVRTVMYGRLDAFGESQALDAHLYVPQALTSKVV